MADRTTIKVDDGSDLVIPLVILVILVVFFGFLLYLLVSSRFSQSPLVTDPSGNISRLNGDTTIPCPPDQCATNLFTGLKRCPPAGEQINSYPSIEVCNSPFLCDNPITPYAVLSDGSATSSGVCQEGITCPCRRLPTCQSYLASIYQATGGTASQALAGQRISFTQEAASQVNGVPNTYMPGSQFCTVPLSWLPLAGCNFVPGGFTNSMDREALQICMDLGTACRNGTLALITDDSENINVATAQYGCVAGKRCPAGQMTVYDTTLGGILCR
jgi:hypothetical protein